jgi:hypothetical protein
MNPSSQHLQKTVRYPNAKSSQHIVKFHPLYRIGQIKRLNCNFVRSWIVFWTALSVPTHCCTQELGNFLNNVYELWADDTGTKVNKEHFPCPRKAWGGCRRRLKTGTFFFAVTIVAGGPSPLASFLELNLDSFHSLTAHWSTMYMRQTH